MKQLPNLAGVLRDTFQTLINQFIDFVPRFLGAIIILIIGVIVARIITLIVRRVLKRVGFDKIGEKLNDISVVKQLKTEIRLSEIVAKSCTITFC